jgi:16S rRNA (cytosine1407-C5)-methyltransferase
LIELSSNIKNYILENFGEDYLQKYQDYFNSNYKSYLRISRSKNSDSLISSLHEYGIELSAIPNIPEAYKINVGENIVGKTLEFVLGQYYIQSLSSMIPALVLNPAENDVTLDMCAAPGSKTTQLSELMNNRGTLVANEISLERMKSLIFNLDKINAMNTGVLKGKGELLSKIYDNYFDKILVDAPCSALGIVQKKGEVSNWWDVKKAEALSEQQIRLLVAAIKMAKVGGEIVYSTCTLSLEENEYVVNKVLNKYPVELLEFDLPIKSIDGFTKYAGEHLNDELKKTRRILPWDNHSEGFFVAKLVKTDDTEANQKYSPKEKKHEFIRHTQPKIQIYLKEISERFAIPYQVFENYKYINKNGDIYFVDRNWNGGVIENFMRIGSKLGSIDKRDKLQIHTAAAQLLGSSAQNNCVEIDKEELEIYFGGGIIRKEFMPFGQKIVLYRNQVIGTASASSEGLKSQFPRAFRTQEIIFPK